MCTAFLVVGTTLGNTVVVHAHKYKQTFYNIQHFLSRFIKRLFVRMYFDNENLLFSTEESYLYHIEHTGVV